MEVPQAPSAIESGATSAEASLSPFNRAVAIFTNPGGAWAGLQTRSQWWFPLVVMTLLGVAFTALLHERAVLPMITEQWEQMVEDGRMSNQQLEQMEDRMRGPAGVAMASLPQVIAWPVIMLLLAAGVSFGVSFILGRKLSFRHAFEVVCWSSLVLIPSYFLTGILAWTKETMRGIHLGLGILVPMAEPPLKWQTGLASFLDAFGPFELWTVALVVIGASTLSGSQRKPTMWVLGGLYLALRALMAALATLFGPGV